MNFIDRSATYLSRTIRSHHPDAASEKVLFYALSLLINSAIAALIYMIICAVTGNVLLGLIVIAYYSILRYCSGGAHMSSSLSCCVVSVILFSGVTFVSYDYMYVGLAFNIISIVIFWFTAPQGIENVSRIDRKYYPHLKLLSIGIVAVNFFIQSPHLSSVALAQAFLTTRASYIIIDFIERRILK